MNEVAQLDIVLFSIKPEYSRKIFDGSKKYEYRKHTAKKHVRLAVIYSSAPVMKVVGEVEILEVLTGSPTKLWELTKKDSGISRERYREYFRGTKKAYAYKLGQVLLYSPPRELIEFNVRNAPQSFIYIDSATLSDFNGISDKKCEHLPFSKDNSPLDFITGK